MKNRSAKINSRTARPVSLEKDTEEGSARARDYLESLFNYANAPIIVWDPSFKIVRFNRAFERLTGYTAKEAIGKNLRMLFPKETRQDSLKKIKRTLNGEYWESQEIPVLRKDGGVRIALWNSANIYAEDKKTIISTIAQGQDITARKKIEEALKETREGLERKVVERTSQLLEINKELNRQIGERARVEMEIRSRNALLRLASRMRSRKEYFASAIKLLRFWSGCRCVGIRLLDEQGRIPYETYIGFTKAFWEKENWLSINEHQCACIRVVKGEFLPPDKSMVTRGGSFSCGNTRRFMIGLTETQKAQFRGNCIREGFTSINIVPIRYKEQIVGAIHLADERENTPSPERLHFIEDMALRIGEDAYRFNLSDKIRATNEILSKVFSSTHVSIVYMDSHFNFIRVNDAYARACGHPPEFFIGKNHFQLYPHAENEAIFKRVVDTGEPFSVLAKPFLFPDHPEWGLTYWDWSLFPLKDNSGKIEGLIFTLLDVTKRKKTEEALNKAQQQLLDAKRLSDIGTLAATVAHELRNPLAAINMASYNIGRKAQDPRLAKHLATIDKKIKESDQIINNLLFYSRIKPPKFEKVNIYELLDECIISAKDYHRRNNIAHSRDIAALKSISIEADPLQLKEVFSNILNNAHDAIYGRKGKVSVSSELDNNCIRILVSDNGIGIDEASLSNIFDPFFSTKAKGTGLGLTVCKHIVSLHGGSIEVNSQKDKGTIVSVTLPRKAQGI